jgi:hypothetical protein
VRSEHALIKMKILADEAVQLRELVFAVDEQFHAVTR